LFNPKTFLILFRLESLTKGSAYHLEVTVKVSADGMVHVTAIQSGGEVDPQTVIAGIVINLRVNIDSRNSWSKTDSGNDAQGGQIRFS
jgi:hypothetical protein